MSILNIGPDGKFLIEAVVLSALFAVVTWRRFGLAAAAGAIMGLAVLTVVWNAETVTLSTRSAWMSVLVASFVIVPSAILLGASRLRWLATRPWTILLLGPVAFAGCYVGLCYCAFRVVKPYFQ